MALLEASGIGKNFGETKVLKDISLTLEQGEALAIIGSSGSGKTTLLRCLNFLETPDRGQILVRDKVLFDAGDPATQRESEIRKKRLHFGMVFQSFNLFPQYTALKNVGQVRPLSPHCCRHTYVTMLQASGVPMETIAALTGHADIKTTEGYLHQSAPALARAVEVLNAKAVS